jgi:two-component system OmpR family response regulator
MMLPRVLVIEDDGDLRRLLRRGLEEEGFDVVQASLGKDAVALAEQDPPDLLVVDIGLPDADGRDVTQAIRSRGIESPVLFLSARDQMVDRLAGFSAGGDDYLTKPFEFAELIARLRALLRRSAGKRPAVVAGDLRLDPAIHAIVSGETTVALTPTEFRLLGALASRHGETVRRRELIATGWPDGAIVHDNTLDVYLGRLRKKLAKLPTEAKIGTVHGVGYKLE